MDLLDRLSPEHREILEREFFPNSKALEDAIQSGLQEESNLEELFGAYKRSVGITIGKLMGPGNWWYVAATIEDSEPISTLYDGVKRAIGVLKEGHVSSKSTALALFRIENKYLLEEKIVARLVRT